MCPFRVAQRIGNRLWNFSGAISPDSVHAYCTYSYSVLYPHSNYHYLAFNHSKYNFEVYGQSQSSLMLIIGAYNYS